MSALGHKRTYAAQKGMSALPPKADMCSATRDVRYGSKSGHSTAIRRVQPSPGFTATMAESRLVHPRNRPSYFEEVYQFSVSHLASCLLE